MPPSPPLSIQENSGGLWPPPGGDTLSAVSTRNHGLFDALPIQRELIAGFLGSLMMLALFKGSPLALRIPLLVDGRCRGASRTAQATLPPSAVGRTPKVRERPATATVSPRPCRSGSESR